MSLFDGNKNQTTSEIMHLTDQDFQEKVLDSKTPVLVDFWAPWCGPCRMLGPILESISKQFTGRLKVAKMNVDENPMVAGAMRIQAIPFLALFKDGKVAQTIVGVRPQQEIARMLEDVLN